MTAGVRAFLFTFGAAHLTIDRALSRIPRVVSTGTRDPHDDNSTLRLSWHSHHGSIHAPAGGDLVADPADEAIRRARRSQLPPAQLCHHRDGRRSRIRRIIPLLVPDQSRWP